MPIHPTTPVIPRLPAIGFGGDWNPEQWPREVWHEDLKLMRDAHVNLVTLGVFSWAYLEPTPGQYEFEWLDTVLDLCLAAGVHVDLATATASPPPWLGHRWPESLPVTDDGVRLVYGARQQYCPSSAPYRERALELTERMASRYADHDAVVMWHVGNEYGAHTPACWCDISAEAFRDWLSKRYDTLDELNAAWSTAFWSQRFSDWSEVIPPRRTPYFPNPTHQLDFKRFSSDALLGLFLAERDIIRAHSPLDKPITTNFMRFFPHADYWDWARAEDVVSDDWYPDLADPRSHVEGAAGADLMRSLGSGQPWLLMEQAVSAINWRAVNPPKSGGAYRRWSLQQVARGADAVLHFQWRAAAGGAEKWHSGMLPHAGPRTRSWDEVVSLGAELESLSTVTGARTPADVVIVLDWSSWWALELDSRPSTLLSMIAILRTWYEPLWRRGYAIDFAHPESDLTGYPLVVVPQLYSVTDRAADRIVQAAEQGSTVAIGYFSGAVDERDRVRTGGYPAPWQELLGLWIEEYRPLLPGDTVDVTSSRDDLPPASVATAWTEHIHLTSGDAVMSYVGGDIDGAPAVTRRTLPTGGRAWYVSTALEPSAMDALVARIAADSSAAPILDAAPPADVEVALRCTTDERFLFLLNHGQSDRVVDARVAGASPWVRANDRQPVEATVSVPSGDVVILVAPAERTHDSP